MLNQPFHQFLTGVFFGRKLVQLRISGKEQLTLNMNQCCRHKDELGRKLDVKLRGLLHIFEILSRNLSDGYAVDVDLLLANKIKQQIKRALVLFKMKI